MDLSIKGKTALVCGSTQGIGRAVALALAEQGADIVLLARDEKALAPCCSGLPKKHGQKHAWLSADFSNPDELETKIHAFIEGKIIHILVNNTGGPPAGEIAEAGTEDFLKAFRMHLLCNHLLAQAVIPGMKRAGYGRIINIISTSVKQPIRGLGVSNTTRGAVAGWAKTLSMELGPYGITVNNVLPGYTETERLKSLIRTKAGREKKSEAGITRSMLEEVPLGRFARPEEIAAVAAFLASPAASYVTGAGIPADGGRTTAI